MEIPKAKEELVKYLKKYYEDEVNNKRLWVDGTRDQMETLTGHSWTGEH